MVVDALSTSEGSVSAAMVLVLLTLNIPAPAPGVVVNKAPFVNFSVSKISTLQYWLLDYLNHIHI